MISTASERPRPGHGLQAAPAMLARRVPGAPLGRTACLPRVKAEGRAASVLLDQRASAAEQPLLRGATRLHPALACPPSGTLPPLRSRNTPLLPFSAPAPEAPHPVVQSRRRGHNRAVGQPWLPDPGPDRSQLEGVPSRGEEASQPAAAARTTRLPGHVSLGD